MTGRPVALGLACLAIAAGTASGVALGFAPPGRSDRTLSRVEYLVALTAACREYRSRIEALPVVLTNTDLIAEVTAQALALDRAQLRAMRAFRPPAALGERARRFFAVVELGVVQLDHTLRRARADDLAGAQQGIVRFRAAATQANALADALGLHC